MCHQFIYAFDLVNMFEANLLKGNPTPTDYSDNSFFLPMIIAIDYMLLFFCKDIKKVFQ